MIGTYAAALLVIGASVPVGAAVLVLAGRREWSWVAPALGLAVITVVAWLAVRLPGEGVTALGAVLALALACGAATLTRAGFGAEQLREGGAAALITLLAVSIPFAAEGHFGILGTGFNVDMSQHLFVADWIASQLAPAPPLIDQGYPVGPHSLAVAAAELPGGNLALAFSGITIAVPVLAALTALAGTRRLGPRRGTVAALLVALPYLVASYLAQGAFKELFEALLVLGFALWLHRLSSNDLKARGFAVPGAVFAAGALYSYSGPGLAWLLGTLAIWGSIELLIDRRRALGRVRTALPALAVALAVLIVAVAPELSRIADFGGSAGNVANSRDSEPRVATSAWAQGSSSDAGGSPAGSGADGDGASLDLFDDDLGNLFGDVPALEALGIWPSGDFRVEPGDGAVPATLFYLGALLGLLALAIGLRASLRAGETALLSALAAALLIWFAALVASTPYTTAKALMMIAPLVTLIAARGVLDPRFSPLRRQPNARSARAGTALAGAYALAVAGSAALALANTPVGPERYTAGISKLRAELTGEPVLLLAPSGQLSDRHGAAFYGWELRGARPICVAAFPDDAGGFDQPTPTGIRYVITVGGKTEPPFEDLTEASRRRRVALWEAAGFDPETAPSVDLNPNEPTSCDLGLPPPD